MYRRNNMEEKFRKLRKLAEEYTGNNLCWVSVAMEKYDATVSVEGCEFTQETLDKALDEAIKCFEQANIEKFGSDEEVDRYLENQE